MDFLDRFAAVLTDADVAQILKARDRSVPPRPSPPAAIRKIATGRSHEYSTMYPGNIDHRWLLLQHGDGFIDLVATDGTLVRTLPAQINTSSQPRWSRRMPNLFYFLHLNQLRMYDASIDTIITVRHFDNLSSINGRGESDLSEDDDHIVLCDGSYVFVYEISTHTIITEFWAPGAFDNLYLTPTNEPVIGLHELGTHVFTTKRELKQLTPSLGHMDVGSNKSGQSIIVRTNSADASSVPNGCPNGVELLDISLGTRTCLLSLDWSIAVHISLPDRAEFALVTTYAPGHPHSQIKHANEILKVPLSGDGEVEIIAKHGAGTVPYTYEGTPRAAISPDGTHFVYDSQGDVYLGTLS